MSLLGQHNALQHTDQRRRFAFCEHDPFTILFFTIYGWNQWFVSMAELVLYKLVACFFHSLPKQMPTLDKICMTVNSTTFDHMGHYNQHKMKVTQRGFKDSLL